MYVEQHKHTNWGTYAPVGEETYFINRDIAHRNIIDRNMMTRNIVSKY